MASMAFRIVDTVEKGEIDNRRRGLVTGRLWLKGCDEPVVLELKGDCRRDLAGCLLSFENPNATPAPDLRLAAVQEGVVGDMTASRKVRVPTVPVATATEMACRGEEVPEQWANCLYLEWYSAASGRVVIETVDFRATVSEPEWTLSESEDRAMGLDNSKTFVEWIERLARFPAPPQDQAPEAEEPEEGE